MPLLDHFHLPLLGVRRWERQHNRWAAAICDGLNETLPAQYFAEMQVKLGTRVEVDVATLTSADRLEDEPSSGGAAAAVQARVWEPAAAVAVMPAVFPDDMEVLVFNDSSSLVGAIELVSPGNKDRDDTRRAFAAKCAAYLHRGIGLIIVDRGTESQRDKNSSREAKISRR